MRVNHLCMFRPMTFLIGYSEAFRWLMNWLAAASRPRFNTHQLVWKPRRNGHLSARLPLRTARGHVPQG
jgi:hypothetical protein